MYLLFNYIFIKVYFRFSNDKNNMYHCKLLKWKAEQDTLKKMKQKKKKPVCKVGIVHHNYYSPPIKVSRILPPHTNSCWHDSKKITWPMSPPKRITRATEKRLLRKQETSEEILRKQNVTRKKKKKNKKNY